MYVSTYINMHMYGCTHVCLSYDSEGDIANFSKHH